MNTATIFLTSALAFAIPFGTIAGLRIGTQEGSVQSIARTFIDSVYEPGEVDRVYDVVEKQATFPGGRTALKKFFRGHTNAPECSQLKKHGRKVFVSAIVEKDGSLSGCTIVKGVSRELDEESLRVVRMLPSCWIPGEINGEKVRSRVVIPVKFASQQKQLCHHDWDRQVTS